MTVDLNDPKIADAIASAPIDALLRGALWRLGEVTREDGSPIGSVFGLECLRIAKAYVEEVLRRVGP